MKISDSGIAVIITGLFVVTFLGLAAWAIFG